MGGSTSTSSQEIELSPEAQELMSSELGMFSQMFLPAEMQGRQDALKGLGSGFGETAGAKGTTKMLNLAESAMARAGQQAGMAPRSLTQALTPMQQQRPESLGAMQNVFREMATQKSGLMDPRFAQFMRPDVQTNSSSSPTSGAMAAQAATLAVAVAGVVAMIAV